MCDQTDNSIEIAKEPNESFIAYATRVVEFLATAPWEDLVSIIANEDIVIRIKAFSDENSEEAPEKEASASDCSCNEACHGMGCHMHDHACPEPPPTGMGVDKDEDDDEAVEEPVTEEQVREAVKTLLKEIFSAPAPISPPEFRRLTKTARSKFPDLDGRVSALILNSKDFHRPTSLLDALLSGMPISRAFLDACKK